MRFEFHPFLSLLAVVVDKMEHNFGVLNRLAVRIAHHGQIHRGRLLIGVFLSGKRTQRNKGNNEAGKGQALDIHGWHYFTANLAGFA